MSFTIGEFRERIDDYEARSADVYNLRREPYHHIDVVRWGKTVINGVERDYCYSVAIITHCREEEPDIRSVGPRIWDCDLKVIERLYWKASEFLIKSWREQHQ